MKKAGVLNRRLSEIIAGMGHTDLVVISDAGFPIPPGVELVDLAVTANVPGIREVVRAVAGELLVEEITLANETRDRKDALANELAAVFLDATVQFMSHDDLKVASASAKAIIRTGECSPFANIMLKSGVTF